MYWDIDFCKLDLLVLRQLKLQTVETDITTSFLELNKSTIDWILMTGRLKFLTDRRNFASSFDWSLSIIFATFNINYKVTKWNKYSHVFHVFISMFSTAISCVLNTKPIWVEACARNPHNGFD